MKRAHHLVKTDDDEESASEAEDTYHMFAVCSKSCKPIIRTVSINGVPTPMELDTGAALTQITYQKIAQLKGVCNP